MGQGILRKIQTAIEPVLVLILILGLSSTTFSNIPEWYSKLKQIELMKTTRPQLEELFGNPKITYSYKGIWAESVDYQLKTGELSIAYSLGKCSEKNKEGFDVEKNVVVDVEFSLKKDINISKLGLDLNKYDKREISDLPNAFNLVNDALGEYYTVIKYGNGLLKVESIWLFSSKSQKSLSCKNVLTNKQKISP